MDWMGETWNLIGFQTDKKKIIGWKIWSLRYGSGSKPCTPGEHQNSWDLWMFIPLKMVFS